MYRGTDVEPSSSNRTSRVDEARSVHRGSEAHQRRHAGLAARRGGRGDFLLRRGALADEIWLHFFYTPAEAEAGLVATRLFEFDGHFVTFRCKESAAKILSRYGHIDQVPFDVAEWDGVDVRGAGKLALTLREHFEDALLFRRIATVDLDAPVSESVDDMIWKGPSAGFDERCAELGAERVATRAHELFWKYEG